MTDICICGHARELHFNDADACVRGVVSIDHLTPGQQKVFATLAKAAPQLLATHARLRQTLEFEREAVESATDELDRCLHAAGGVVPGLSTSEAIERRIKSLERELNDERDKTTALLAPKPDDTEPDVVYRLLQKWTADHAVEKRQQRELVGALKALADDARIRLQALAIRGGQEWIDALEEWDRKRAGIALPVAFYDPQANEGRVMKAARAMTDEELAAEQKKLGDEWDEFQRRLSKDDEGWGGSPGEWMSERMSELDTEQARRAARKETL